MKSNPQHGISTIGLTKFYGKQRGVENISFNVKLGEVVGFVGPNGSGKTTVMRMLLSLIHISSGTAQILGNDITTSSVKIRNSVGYLPGNLGLYKNLRVGEYLRFLAEMRGGNFDAKIYELSERLALNLSAEIQGLSKGTRQKVGVVQAFMHSPKVLILDEPTSGLDPIVQQEFESILLESRDSGAAILLSSHVMHEVESLASRVAIVSKGQLVLIDYLQRLRESMVHTLRMTFTHQVSGDEFSQCAGVKEVRVHGFTIECFITGSQLEALALAVRYGVISIESEAPSMEDIFIDATASKNVS